MSAALTCRDLTVAPDGRVPVLRGLSLDVAAGTRTALVGPSGAGKTTLLRAIAGLSTVQAGEIRLGDRALTELPAHRRRVAVVFQEPRLLPHLDVVENVALPLRATGVARTERLARARALLDDVGLAAVADRRIAGLSGGEQQRVALARALCAEPELLLLDEPLASVDPNRRDDLRRLVAALQEARAVTTLIVTHDREEAAQLGDAVALMLEGRIVQHGPPHELFERPATAAVARFFGAANLLRGVVHGGRLDLEGAAVAVPGPDGPAAFAIRPEHVRLDEAGAVRGTVVEATYAGTHVRIVVQAGATAITADVPVPDAPAAGATVTLDLPVARLWRLPADDPVSAPG